EPGATHAPEERSAAIGEDPAVAPDEPVPTADAEGAPALNRTVQGQRVRVAEKPRVAEVVDDAVSERQPESRAARGGECTAGVVGERIRGGVRRRRRGEQPEQRTRRGDVDAKRPAPHVRLRSRHLLPPTRKTREKRAAP